MKHLFKFIAVLLLLALFGFAILTAVQFNSKTLTHEIELLVNKNTKSIFGGSVKIGKASLDNHFILHIDHLSATLKSGSEKIPIQINSLETIKPIPGLLRHKNLLFRFDGFKLHEFAHAGTSGTFRLELGGEKTYELIADIREIGLEELRWVNRSNLESATGNLKGHLSIKGHGREIENFEIEMNTDDAGGVLKASVLDSFLSYIPQVGERDAIKQLVSKGGVVPFRKGYIKTELLGPNRLKVLLKMLILEYNLDLNLNMEIRTDAENALSDLAKLMSFLKVTIK